MCFTCDQPYRMSVMVQIRNMPSDLHRQVKARAALEGFSLSEYLLREVRNAMERPTLEEMQRRLAQRTPVRPRITPAAAIRAERESRRLSWTLRRFWRCYSKLPRPRVFRNESLLPVKPCMHRI